MLLRVSRALLASMVFTSLISVEAAIHRVSPGQSIQAAIDVAAAGDTILVEPGTYIESPESRYGLRISTNNLRLIGIVRTDLGDAGKVRLLYNDTDQSLQETGVFAAPAGCEYDEPLEACKEELQGFYIRGFSVEGFPQNGIQTRWVNNFRFVGNESINNLNNGIYPTLSANGLVRDNVSYGSLDTAMWVAGSENVRVIGNEMYGSPIGFEISVSNNVFVARNDIHDNTLGVGLFHPNAAGNGPLDVMQNWVIVGNRIYNNNLENPAPPGSFQGTLPRGGGVLLLGVSDHIVRDNQIENNDFFGVGLLGWCTATIVDAERNCGEVAPITSPAANNNDIVENILLSNGLNPPSDYPLAPLAADVIYFQLEFDQGNCFENNEPEGEFTFFSFRLDGLLPTQGC